MTPARFDCVMSRSLAVSTTVLLGVVALLPIGLAAAFSWAGERAGWPPRMVWTVAVILGTSLLGSVGLVLVTWLLSPRAILITDGAVVVERRLSPVTIPFRAIKGVRVLVPGDLAGTIRTGGASGVFAHIGRFRSPALGDFRMYLRDEADGVVVDAGERFVLSPRPPLGFVAELTGRLRGGKEPDGARRQVPLENGPSSA